MLIYAENRMVTKGLRNGKKNRLVLIGLIEQAFLREGLSM